MVDRVTASYLGPESLVLDSFKLKLLTNRPLSDFRDAYMHVRGHATALLCSRRNEGDHRNLKLEARLAYNISGPLLMARLRNGQTTDNMNAADFVTLAGKLWNSRGKSNVVNQLLEHLFPLWQLVDMSWHTRILHVYGPSPTELFTDLSAARTEVASFKALQPAVRRTVLTPLEQQIRMTGMSMLYPGTIISLPRNFLAPATAGRTPTFTSIAEALQRPSSYASLDDLIRACVFVEVGTSRERIRMATSSALADVQYSVRGVQFAVASHDGVLITLRRTGDIIDIDINSIVVSSLVLQLFTHIESWVRSDTCAVVVPKRFRLQDAVASNLTQVAMPMLMDVNANMDASVAIGGSGGGAIRNVTQTDQDAAIASLFDQGVADSLDPEYLPSSTSVCHAATVSMLVERGIAASMPDEFGEHRLALRSDAICVTSLLLVGNQGILPHRAVQFSDLSLSLTKFELLSACIGAGIEMGDTPQFYTPYECPFIPCRRVSVA